jgi:hypothetical protein
MSTHLIAAGESRVSQIRDVILSALTSLGSISIDRYAPTRSAATDQCPQPHSLDHSADTTANLGIRQLIGGSLSDVCGRRKRLLIGFELSRAQHHRASPRHQPGSCFSTFISEYRRCNRYRYRQPVVRGWYTGPAAARFLAAASDHEPACAQLLRFTARKGMIPVALFT